MKSLFGKIKQGFQKTRESMSDGIREVLRQNPKIDPELYDDLEAVMLRADVGPATTAHLLDELRGEVKRRGIEHTDELRVLLGEIMERVLIEGVADSSAPDGDGTPKTPDVALTGPRVVLMVGVNGVGKTTSLAKLVKQAKDAGESPIIVASDTFRAAASEQLEVWARRLEVEIVRSQTGADPGSVAFDGIRAGMSRESNPIFIDTAGRLQTKGNLMDELKKIHRVCGKALDGAPHDVFLVLDATIGQNAMSQARLFAEAVPVTGIVLSKLDGTSKGGVILAIAHELKIPVRFVGVGEQADDLLEFDPKLFAQGLIGDEPAAHVQLAGRDMPEEPGT